MLLIVSDLHLADTAVRATFDPRQVCDMFAREAKEALLPGRGAPGVETLTILLLGDIFEVLKSEQWGETSRPWDPPSDGLHDVVTRIFNDIVRVNQETFFDPIATLKKCYGERLEFIYVPGNHDWPINGQEIGFSARKRILELLQIPSRSPVQLFSPSYVREEYGLVAKHGHEHDPLNRTTPGRIAFGDAMVIEVLVALPKLVAKYLPCEPSDERLDNFHELDNVRPQSKQALAAWLLIETRRLAEGAPNAPKAVSQALKDIAHRMAQLSRSEQATPVWAAEHAWIGRLVTPISKAVGPLRLAKAAGKLSGGESDTESYAHHARKDLAQAGFASHSFAPRLIVHGHTHLPELVPLPDLCNTQGQAPVYLNTGTWRKVHRFTPETKGEALFADYEEQSYVIVHNEQERRDLGTKHYEFRRAVRG